MTIHIFSFTCYLLLSIGLAFLIVKFVGERSKVTGSSMEPHLKHNDQIIIEKLSYRFRNPKRFEIIVIPLNKHTKKAYYIKRVIAMPEETIQIKKGHIYINDQKLDDIYGLEEIKHSGLASKKIHLKAEEYFVLGDHRNDSLDSRDVRMGIIGKKEIIGRAWMKIKKGITFLSPPSSK